MRPYKIYKQSEGQCGPASLRSQIYYWLGREVQEEEVRRFAKSSRKEGSSSEGLVRATKMYGLNAVHISKNGTILGLLSGLVSQGVYPVVCYTDRDYKEDHWASVLSISKKVVVADSVSCRKKHLDFDEFYSDWSEITNEGTFNNTLAIFPNDPIWRRRLSWLNKCTS